MISWRGRQAAHTESQSRMAQEDGDARLERQIPALRRFAYALTRDPHEADDLVQDCLERALSRWFLRRDDGDLRVWLFTILRNLHLDRLRAARRRPEAPLESAPERAFAGDQEATLDLRDMLAALDKLPEESRSLLLLVGVEDFSYEDAARALGLPVGTVMSRLSRARKALRLALDGGRTLLRRVR
jgi:RNA polymerase sigma-70 factor (ECF subfamily)